MTDTTLALMGYQNHDGGWPYRPGSDSAMEPTCYALTALAGQNALDRSISARAFRWLSGLRREDGGFAPLLAVKESTWVTALALLLPNGLLPPEIVERAGEWVLAQSNRDSTFIYRLRMRLLGAKVDPDQALAGWSWYPGTAGWVSPTALSILALQKLRARTERHELRERVLIGQKFLLSRRCQDGGWNHGSSNALGYSADSYPETTGMALLALWNSQEATLGRSLELAERQLSTCKHAEGCCWLRMALSAHGLRTPPVPVDFRRDTRNLALWAITEAALQGNNPLLEKS